MRALPRKPILISGLLLGAGLIAWALAASKPPVSLTVLGYTTNRWPDNRATEFGNSTYVRAIIAVTNNSKRTFVYCGSGSAQRAPYSILRHTLFGWNEPNGVFRCGTGLEMYPLPPSHGFTFEATIHTPEPCKVAFEYSDGRTPSPIWQKLPYWLVEKLPWASPWATACTEVIDLSKGR